MSSNFFFPEALLMADLLRKMFGGESAKVFKGMATLALGSGTARVIGIAAIPILTRLYDPEDFGVLAVFTALVAILAPIITLRYALALPLPRRDETALNLLILSAGLMVVGIALITFLLAIFAEPLLILLSMETLASWWYLIPVGIFAAASYELMTYWATRKRNYRIIAQTNMLQSFTGNLVKIGAGSLSFGPLGLLIGAVISQGGGLLRLTRAYLPYLRSSGKYVSKKRLRVVAWKYRDFPYFRVPSHFAMAFSQQAPLLFFASIYGENVTGQFSLALLTLSLPATLIAGAVGNSIYAEAAALEKGSSYKIYRIAKDVQKKLLFFSIPIALLIYLFGEISFVIIFGENWRLSGYFASILSFYLVFLFSSLPLMQLLNVVGSQLSFLFINLMRAVLVSIFVLYALIYDASSEHFVILYSSGLSLFFMFVSIYSITRVRGTSVR